MNQRMSTLGSVVRETRKDKKLSQEALAERIGVCKRTIIDIENNTGNPKFEILYLLVRELGLPLNQIFYPEVEENFELKNICIHEIENCSENEMKIILSVIKSLRYALENQELLLKDFDIKEI